MIKFVPGVSSFTTNLIFIVLNVLGLICFFSIPINFSEAKVTQSIDITYEWRECPARIIEQEVTSKLEGVLSTIRNVTTISSESGDGYGKIKIEFENYADYQHIRYEVSTLIRQVFSNLPHGISYPSIHLNRVNLSEVGTARLILMISGNTSTTQLVTYAENKIKQYLLKSKNIAKIYIYGAPKKQLHLRYDYGEILNKGLTLKNIEESFNNNFKQYELRAKNSKEINNIKLLDFNSLGSKHDTSVEYSSINNILIQKNINRNIYLQDVAQIKEVMIEDLPIYKINGLNSIRLEIIPSESNSYLFNIYQFASHCEQLLDKLDSKYFISKFSDSSIRQAEEITNLIYRLILMLVTSIIFIWLYTKDFRFVIVSCIGTFSIFNISAIIFYLINITLNIYELSIFVLAIGFTFSTTLLIISQLHKENKLSYYTNTFGLLISGILAISPIFIFSEEKDSSQLYIMTIWMIIQFVSIIVGLTLVTSLVYQFNLDLPSGAKFSSVARGKIIWITYYMRLIDVLIRYKSYVLIAIFFLFGFPIFLLPQSIEQDNYFGGIYNSIFEKNNNNDTRELLEKYLGGTFSRFSQTLKESNNTTSNETKPYISININMPDGGKLEDIKNICQAFEDYLSKIKQIKRYTTAIFNTQNANIQIEFGSKIQSAIISEVKETLQKKAMDRGLADFKIEGIGQVFDNEIFTEHANNQMIIQGFNYETLREIGETVKAELLENKRINEVYLTSKPLEWFGAKSSNHFSINVQNGQVSTLAGLFSNGFLNSFSSAMGTTLQLVDLKQNGNYIPVFLINKQQKKDFWNQLNKPIPTSNNNFIRLKDMVSLKKEKVSEMILRRNQQYQLVISYNFVGTSQLQRLITDRITDKLNDNLPLGFSIIGSKRDEYYSHRYNEFVIICISLIIIFISNSVFLNNVRQALVLTIMIPITFIGLFIGKIILSYNLVSGGMTPLLFLIGFFNSILLIIIKAYSSTKHPIKVLNLKIFAKTLFRKKRKISLITIPMLIAMSNFIIIRNDDGFWYEFSISCICSMLFAILIIPIILPIIISLFHPKQKNRKKTNTNLSMING